MVAKTGTPTKYPAYKDSGTPWLGDIPDHWKTQRFKYLLREQEVKSKDGSEQLLRVSQYTGVTERKRLDERDGPDTRAASLIGYKCVQPGDLVVNIMLAWNGSLGISPYQGIVSPAYCVYRFNGVFDNGYFHYLLRSPAYKSKIKTLSTGVVESRLRLYSDALYRLEALIPPLAEQTAIVRFLDHTDQRIRRYIRAKQKLIKLLNEQKQAIIHQAVTRGLDPNVRLKPSGVEWLGDVPEHWEITKIKREFDCLNNRRIPLSSTQRGEMKLRQYDYYGASSAIDKVDEYIFDDELLLIAEDGANLVLRNLPLAVIAKGKFWVNNHAHILKPRRGNLSYLANLVEGINFIPWISGAAQPKLTKERLLNISICVPTPIEQYNIMQWISIEVTPIENSIKRVKAEVSLLQEYRTRLIADVVTGKLDVRAAAASLPEELADLDPLETEEILEDADEAGDEPGEDEGDAMESEA